MAPDIHRNALKPGYRVHWYQIETILGQGGFGITYLADDTNLNQKVAVKEYLPVEVAVREHDYSVHPVSQNHDESYRWGLDRFLDEARALARFDHPNIVRVLSVFEMNNTAYMVMRYENGDSFQQMLPKRSTLEEDRLKGILFPILDGLKLVHREGFIHRDVKPANIFIREDGTPVLLDFGSARQSLGEATRTLTTLVSPGYAPFEQYFSKSDKQGPWTDIYGLGASMYRAVVGVPPMNAVDRSESIIKQGQDPLVPAAVAAAERYSETFLRAIDWSLRFNEQDRPQDIDQWRRCFDNASAPPPLPGAHADGAATEVRAGTETTTERISQTPKPPTMAPGPEVVGHKPRPSMFKFLVAFVVLIALLGVGLAAVKRAKQAGQTEPTAEASAAVEPRPAAMTTPAASAPAALETEAQRISRLLNEADSDIKALRLSKPPGNNALEKYREVLALDPGNKEANRGLRKIVQTYAELGKKAFESKDYDRAGLYLNEALEIAPNSKQLKKAKARLDRLRRAGN